MTVFALANDALRKSERSSIGRRWCRSSRMKTTKNTAATPNRARTSGSPQPRSFDLISPYVSAKSAIADVARPGKSRRCSVVSLVSSMKIRAATMPEDPDRDVDVEDPAPVDVLGDHAADQRPDRQRQRRDAGPDADRHAALPRRERRGDDRQRRRVHQRRADALHDARADQHAGAVREAAEERRRGEDDEADDEDAPPAEHVRELSAA